MFGYTKDEIDALLKTLTDSQLVKRTIQRKTDASPAFAELYGRYQRKLAAYVSAKVNYNQSLIDDVIQDTFSTAWKNIHQLKDSEKFFQWVVTIARNNAMDVLRDRKKAQELNEIFGVDESSEQPETLDLGETEAILATLSDDEREIVVYKAILEYSFEEIACELNQTLSATKMRYYRAMEKLKAAHT